MEIYGEHFEEVWIPIVKKINKKDIDKLKYIQYNITVYKKQKARRKAATPKDLFKVIAKFGRWGDYFTFVVKMAIKKKNITVQRKIM